MPTDETATPEQIKLHLKRLERAQHRAWNDEDTANLGWLSVAVERARRDLELLELIEQKKSA